MCFWSMLCNFCSISEPLHVETYCEILLNIFQVSGTQAEWHALASEDKVTWLAPLNHGDAR
jgi:hypothetical protein